MSTPASPSKATGDRPFTQRRDFWTLIGLAVVLGIIGGVFGLLFMGLIGVANNWYDYSSAGWMGGRWWWIAVTAAAGVLVGLLRRLTHLPDKSPGLIADVRDEYVDPKLVAGVVIVSAASLSGAASVGPEKALGTFGGGTGGWMATRGGLDAEDRHVTALSGMAGAFGGLLSSTVIVVMLLVEIARPGGTKLTKVLVSSIVSSSISFGIYFAVAGSVFLGIYPVPTYQYEDWQLLAGAGLGLLAAVICALMGLIVAGSAKLFDKLKAPMVVKSTIGGVIFGVIGVALPLTMFTGSDQLAVVLEDGSALGLGLVVLLVIVKIITIGVSFGSGFVGGPVLPTIFIGGSAGVAVHLAFEDLPLGLTFTCMLAAVVGGFVEAPFTMVLLAVFMTQVGALNTAPALVAVITAFLAVEAVKYAVVGRKCEAAAKTNAEPPMPAPTT